MKLLSIKHIIAIVILATLCVSMAAPIYAYAATFLVALPAIWAVLAAAGVIVAAINYIDDRQQTQHTANAYNQASLKESPTQFSDIETSATFKEENDEMNLK